MALQENVPFHIERKKDGKEKPENIQAWIKSSYENNEGSWSFVYINGKKDIFSFYGKENITDKNRIHLIPLLELMEWIDEPIKKRNLIVYTTSIYVVNCISEWLDKWKRNDFKIEEKGYRPNSDILRKIDVLRVNTTISVKLLMLENEFSSKADMLCHRVT